MTRNDGRSKDYYKILGVSLNADETEIRKAYRRLALEWHPDRNSGRSEATERFKEISEAYAVLIDPGKRALYDQARRPGVSDFRCSQEDILRDFFRNPGTIFEELAREFEKMGMRVDRRYFRQTLFGGGAAVFGGVFVLGPVSLPGLGRLLRSLIRLPSPSQLAAGIAKFGKWLLGPGPGADVTCQLRLTASEAARGGSRQIACQTGPATESVLLNIPAGIRPGARLRLRGKGRWNPDGTRGDLYLEVMVSD